ncbi:MAG: hypothetical protein K5840_00695, partial [Eubacterium sp.]|nr:hypothetical protein [Eubacterium sp.]
MKNRKKKLAAVLIAQIVIVIGVLTALVASVGYWQFTNVVSKEYNDSAYEIAYTALDRLNPDKFDEYLSTGETDEEYDEILQILDDMVLTCNLNFIYAVEVSDD